MASLTPYQWMLAAFLLVASTTTNAFAQSEDLSVEQAQLAEKFARLELLAVRIAELVEIDNPDRAEQLRGAIAQSRELALNDRFDAVVGLLNQERFAAASRNQGELADNLDTLLTLLLADPREARLEAERRRLQQAIKEIGKLIREQHSLRGQTLELADPSSATGDQQELADEANRIEESLGKPSGNMPDSDKPSGDSPGGKSPDAKQRATQRLQQARQSMKKASGQLSEGDRSDAAKSQTDAQRELEQAREELEEALRQTREEEAMRTLTRLAARLRRILGEQTEINRLTLELQELHGDQASLQKRSAAAGLAQREDDALRIAAGALRLLQDGGGSLAFEEVLEQVSQDMSDVSGRLNKGMTAQITQSIEQDIVLALEEAIEALDQQLSEMAEQQQQGSQPSPAGQTQEPPLVDALAELRMLRSLQKRILARTQRYELMADADEITEAQLDDALGELARRQRRAIQAAQALADTP